MLAANPEVVNYMGRVLLDPAGPRGHLLERLTELASSAVGELRRQLSGPDSPGTDKPVLEVRVQAPGPPPGH